MRVLDKDLNTWINKNTLNLLHDILYYIYNYIVNNNKLECCIHI